MCFFLFWLGGLAEKSGQKREKSTSEARFGIFFGADFQDWVIFGPVTKFFLKNLGKNKLKIDFRATFGVFSGLAGLKF